ncbi:hypothetical protein [Halomonas cupida]|uniref:hypothetical protein n=1 Tax=Halomonas cupida TaxID=44933 RepID=UPI003A9590C8
MAGQGCAAENQIDQDALFDCHVNSSTTGPMAAMDGRRLKPINTASGTILVIEGSGRAVPCAS